MADYDYDYDYFFLSIENQDCVTPFSFLYQLENMIKLASINSGKAANMTAALLDLQRPVCDIKKVK